VHTARDVPQEVAAGLGVLDVEPSREEIATTLASVTATHSWRPIMLLALDGAEVPTRPETAKGRRKWRQKARATRAQWTREWREAKGFRFYLIADERIVQGPSWQQVHTDDETVEALRQV
jgi:hypothetical protein